jgi:hypothetical protein
MTEQKIECPIFISQDSAVRKMLPVATGVLKYFPNALKCVAFISKVGNDKHNPGQPLHWAKGKSTDQPDCEVRHMLDGFQNAPAEPGLEVLGRLAHKSQKAWRALADLETDCEAVIAEYEEFCAKNSMVFSNERIREIVNGEVTRRAIDEIGP